MVHFTLITFIGAFLFNVSLFIQASEVDSHTKRQGKLEDATDIINTFTKIQMAKALSEANRLGKCSKKRLYRHLRHSLKYAGLSRVLPNYVAKLPKKFRRDLRSSRNLYKYFNWKDSLAVGGVAHWKWKKIRKNTFDIINASFFSTTGIN